MSMNNGTVARVVKSRSPAYDFHGTHERARERGSGNADLQKAPRAECGGKEELLNAFRKEDPAHQDANEQDAQREAELRILWRHRHDELQANFPQWLGMAIFRRGHQKEETSATGSRPAK